MKYLWATAAVTVLLGNANMAQAANNAVSSALASRDDLSFFSHALVETGVADTLRADTPYTLFVPTNAAMANDFPNLSSCYSFAVCRADMAAVIRNHIVPENERISVFSRRGGGIATIGTRKLNVEEPFKGAYTVENIHILNQSDGTQVKIYRINAAIASQDELAHLRAPLRADIPATVTESKTTTHVTGYAPVHNDTIETHAGTDTVVAAPSEFPDHATQTTTITHSTTTQTVE